VLFNNALDPFLYDFFRALKGGKHGIVRACADDLAFTLTKLKHLKIIEPIYAAARLLAGLELKPKKCKIVPLVAPTAENFAKVKLWIQEQIPQWKDFEVKGAAEMLGFFIGPQMGLYNWCKPLTKYRDRIRDIRVAGASISMNCYDYNARVVPVTSYQAQLLPLPPSHLFMERVAMTTVLRAPFNTFRHLDFFQLSKVGIPQLRSVNVACASALYRTAAKTLPGWTQWIRQMEIVATDLLPAAFVHRNILYPEFWDTKSVAQNLQYAFEGFEKHSNLLQGERKSSRSILPTIMGSSLLLEIPIGFASMACKSRHIRCSWKKPLKPRTTPTLRL
jgi:hypothetical protein